MPVNYQDIQTKVRAIGEGAGAHQERLKQLQMEARERLARRAADLDEMRRMVEMAREKDPSVRCALPLVEPLDYTVPPPAALPEAVVIAVDGSQINPDRHAAVQFCVVNVGAVTLRTHSGQAPQVETLTRLYYGDDLYKTGGGMKSEDSVALDRDLWEREKLDELSGRHEGLVVTMTDGPLELWGAKGEDKKAYEAFVERYRGTLSRLAGRGVVTAGYVERPTANLVCRLLEIAGAAEADLAHLSDYHPLRGVTDLWLYGETRAPLLPPGHRSAVFGLQSSSDKYYTGQLSLHFFYLNVGSEGHPWPVRVEVPRWVVDDRRLLDALHAVLMDQCRILSLKPYPYLLHRAHETAVVGREEKAAIMQMIQQELARRGQALLDGSHKQAQKDLPGRSGRR